MSWRVVLLLALTLTAVAFVAANWSRFSARLAGMGLEAQLTQAIEATPSQGTIDLAAVLDVPWDRVVWIQPYSLGSDGNALLGFDFYDEGDWLSSSDSRSRLVLLRDGAVVADLELSLVYFTGLGEAREFFPNAATFTVDHDDEEVYLVAPDAGRS